MAVNLDTTSPIPASSLLDLTERKIAPLDRPLYLVSVDGLFFTHPASGNFPLIEEVGKVGDYVHVTLWTARRMIGIELNDEDLVTVAYDLNY